MWGYIAAGVFALWTMYLMVKYGFRPYLRMLRYANYKGGIMLPFSPVIGPFQQPEESVQLAADEHFLSKKTFLEHPEARFYIFNAFDKCFLMLVDPDLLHQFFQKQDLYLKEQEFAKNKVRFFGKGLVFNDGEESSRRRKRMSSIFHECFFSQFVAKISAIVDRQMAAIQRHDITDFEAKRLSALISGDVVLATFFGVSFSEKLNGKPLSIDLSNLIRDIMAQQHSLRYFLFGIKLLELGLFSEDKRVSMHLEKVKALLRASISKRLTDSNIEEGSVLRAIKDDNLLSPKDRYCLEELTEQFLGFYVVGTDPTANLMTMCFYYLSIYPSHQETLRRQIVESGVLSKLDFRTISSLKFLQAFVKESYRHYNYLMSTYPRVCLKRHELGEIVIEQGDVVMPGWVHNHYNQRYFPNPDNFDPERWLKPDEKELNLIFTPINSGSRSCLGQNFALLQSKVVLIKLVGQFQLQLRQKGKAFLKVNTIFQPVNSIMVDVTDLT